MRQWSEAELREKLSARQYEVLSLVARHLSSKEIGADLGLSYKTIDNHVADMMMKLGVSSRADAARLFLDAQGPRERLPSTPEPLDSAAVDDALVARPEADILGETELAGTEISLQTTASSMLKLPPVGGPRHDLTVVQRLVAMGQVAFVSVAALAAIVTVIVGILSLLRR